MYGKPDSAADYVVLLNVVHAAKDGVAIGPPGQLRQQLADLEPGRGSRDRPKRAADLGGSVGLGVPGLVVTRAAPQPEQQHRLDPRRSTGGLTPRRSRRLAFSHWG